MHSLSDLPPLLSGNTFCVVGACKTNPLSKVWSGLWKGDQIKEERMTCLELAEEAILVRDNVPRPLSWVESSCLWHNYFYKAREGTGQQGRRSMSGSGKKKSTAGSPVGTNWNRTQLEVTLHAFQMPPWNRFLVYLCKGGTWNNSEITTTPWPRNCDSPEPQCPCWEEPHWSSPRRALTTASEDPWDPCIVGKGCAYKYFPERWLLAFIKFRWHL